ncbi:chromate resistance protein ChrB domain-containing protein [Sphingomonas sanxanigenens]|uniref:ChrB protein n=1 Tax=Sphingomonas sanxanigenens DSM 19645 = NX02 TaxID=1123269 RepID=W0AG91_9SPHN|nr:chromate resistance protein ChrB domain-containing protein [Sphingomonas sanxanigenens]AHE55303.1 hypothetical protein NX02_18170 [Sphingomonas sanxanigenens DSM 19645 = NX02]
MPTTRPARWLALLHQLPTKPPYLRVKIWRRLQAIGAVPLKNAVHVLPRTSANEAVFRALLDEIVAGGGDATLVDGVLLAGQSDKDIRALFDAARDADYAEIADTARRLIETGPASEAEIARLQKRLAEVGALDPFGAHGRQQAEAALAELDRRRGEHPDIARTDAAPDLPGDLTGRIWVTRSGVHVDRIACAWLIRRFIDRDARFRFVAGRSHAPTPGELRFDMADAEFTHEGERCSFETLLLRAGPADDAALVAIGEIIHDLDIGDGRFGRPETAGLGAMLQAICATSDADEERIARASDIFDQFHAFFGTRGTAR